MRLSRCSRPPRMLLVVIAVARLAFGREAAQGAIVDELIGAQTGAALEGMIASASLCQRAGRDEGSTSSSRAALICCPSDHFPPVRAFVAVNFTPGASPFVNSIPNRPRASRMRAA
jgi:hypothetical protein